MSATPTLGERQLPGNTCCSLLGGAAGPREGPPAGAAAHQPTHQHLCRCPVCRSYNTGNKNHGNGNVGASGVRSCYSTLVLPPPPLLTLTACPPSRELQ